MWTHALQRVLASRRLPFRPYVMAGALGASLVGALPIGGAALGATPVGSEFQVNTYTTSLQSRPSVSTAADGDFVVVWHHYV